jgi:hypothetical protein
VTFAAPDAQAPAWVDDISPDILAADLRQLVKLLILVAG